MEIIELTCICGAIVKIALLRADYDTWINTDRSKRPFVQVLFPYLSSNDREMLVSKICPTCWTKMFKDIEKQ